MKSKTSRKTKQIKNRDYRLERYFVGGKMKHHRIPLIEGLPAEEFLRRNADDATLMELGHYGILHEREIQRNQSVPPLR